MASEKPRSAPVHEEKKGQEYLANERTFLAWIRTSVAVMSLGFLISRFAIWLREMGPEKAAKQFSPTGASLWIGELMMGVGGVLGILAAWRYHVVNRDIEKGQVSADRGLVVFVAGIVLAVAVAMIVYMIKTTP